MYTLEFELAVSEACPAETQDDDAFAIDFEPGALVKLGAETEPQPQTQTQPEPQPEPVPEPVPDAELPATNADAVTDDEDTAPRERPQQRDEPAAESAQKPRPLEPRNLLPVAPPRGDPFGDSQGWAELVKDGDPWATAVMKALAGMPVGAFGGEMGDGTAKFQITVCKNGTVKKVRKKGGTLGAIDQARVANAARALSLPKPPAKVARQMKGGCAKLEYTFVWSDGAVK